MRRGLLQLIVLGSVVTGGSCSRSPELENRLPLRASAPLLVLSDSAVVHIGAVSDSIDDEFDTQSGFLDAVPLLDSGLLVIDGSRLRRFSRAGVELWRFGTPGRGPWEFASLASACLTRGDTIIAFDAGTRRLTIVAGDGSPVRMTDVSALGIAPRRACLAAGSVLMVSVSAATEGDGFLARLSSVQTDGTAREVADSLPFKHRDRLAVLLPHGDWFWSAAPWQRELRRVREDGTLISVYHLAEPERVMSEEEARRSRRMEGAMGSPGGHQHSSLTAPFFDEAVHGDGGALWLRTFNGREQSLDTWVGISPEGRLIGQFSLPHTREVVLVAVTDAGIWLLRRDTPDGSAIFENRRFMRGVRSH